MTAQSVSIKATLPLKGTVPLDAGSLPVLEFGIRAPAAGCIGCSVYNNRSVCGSLANGWDRVCTYFHKTRYCPLSSKRS
jgi:hypothetical protein